MLAPFQPHHLMAMALQPGQAHELVSLEQAAFAQQMGPSWSLLRGERVVASGGMFVVSQELSIGWAYLAADAGPSMLEIVRALRAGLRAAPTERVDFLVLDGFAEAHRLAKVLRAVPTRTVEVTSRDGSKRGYTVYSRARDGWH
jgi:hypothetical protein